MNKRSLSLIGLLLLAPTTALAVEYNDTVNNQTQASDATVITMDGKYAAIEASDTSLDFPVLEQINVNYKKGTGVEVSNGTVTIGKEGEAKKLTLKLSELAKKADGLYISTDGKLILNSELDVVSSASYRNRMMYSRGDIEAKENVAMNFSGAYTYGLFARPDGTITLDKDFIMTGGGRGSHAINNDGGTITVKGKTNIDMNTEGGIFALKTDGGTINIDQGEHIVGGLYAATDDRNTTPSIINLTMASNGLLDGSSQNGDYDSDDISYNDYSKDNVRAKTMAQANVTLADGATWIVRDIPEYKFKGRNVTPELVATHTSSVNDLTLNGGTLDLTVNGSKSLWVNNLKGTGGTVKMVRDFSLADGDTKAHLLHLLRNSEGAHKLDVANDAAATATPQTMFKVVTSKGATSTNATFTGDDVEIGELVYKVVQGNKIERSDSEKGEWYLVGKKKEAEEPKPTTPPEEKPSTPEKPTTQPDEKPTNPGSDVQPQPDQPDKPVTPPDKKPSTPEKPTTQPDEKPANPGSDVQPQPDQPDKPVTPPDEKPSTPDKPTTQPDEKPANPGSDVQPQPDQPDKPVTPPDEKPSTPDKPTTQPDEKPANPGSDAQPQPDQPDKPVTPSDEKPTTPTTPAKPEIPVISTSADAALNQFAALTIAARSQLQTLDQRLGDLRLNTSDQAGWIRVYGGSYNLKPSKETDTFGLKTRAVQFGYDRTLVSENGKNFIGGFINLGNATLQLKEQGEGTLRTVGFGIYATHIASNGVYLDIVAGCNRDKGSFDVKDTKGESVTANATVKAFTLSGELGKRFDLSSDAKGVVFVEPQAQLSLHHQRATDFTAANGLKVHADAANSLVGRLSAKVGYQSLAKPYSAYLKVNFEKELKGDLSVRFNKGANVYSVSPLKDGQFTLGLGGTAQFGNAKVYLEGEKGFGSANFQKNWHLTGGIRLDF